MTDENLPRDGIFRLTLTLPEYTLLIPQGEVNEGHAGRRDYDHHHDD